MRIHELAASCISINGVSALLVNNCDFSYRDFGGKKEFPSYCVKIDRQIKNDEDDTQADFLSFKPQSTSTLQEQECTYTIPEGMLCSPQFDGCFFSNAKTACVEINQETNPLFKNCQITTRDIPQICKDGFGIISKNASAEFLQCTFSNCRQFAVYLSDKSKVTLKDSTITANVNLGLAIRDYGTEVNVINCHITAHTSNGGCLVENSANVQFKNCKFTRNLFSHLAIQNQARCTIDGCEFWDSGSGKSIMITHQANAEIHNSKIHDEATVGILLSTGSNLILESCELSKCGDCAIYIQDQYTKALLKKNYIYDNISDGVQVLNGDVTFDENTITGQAGNGIYFLASVKQNILPNNIIKDNQIKDIFIQG